MVDSFSWTKSSPRSQEFLQQSKMDIEYDTSLIMAELDRPWLGLELTVMICNIYNAFISYFCVGRVFFIQYIDH